MKGHPVLGSITGFFFGLFLAVSLFLYGVIPLSSALMWILPLVGILLGLIMAAWAPFGKGAEPTPVAAPATLPPASGTPTPPPPPATDAGPTGDDPTTS
jgi:hypothetical protein